ncbi:MAG: hypothetical protein KF841_12010 [Phycisphaerae bacterium]|nr:hypothetical protein [Phycisphaerae bacterium]
MNCYKYRKYLLAFADGQTSVQVSCDVLDHLKMCPSCSAVVDDHHGVRRRLANASGRITLPAGLEARIRSALIAETLATSRTAHVSSSSRRIRPLRALAVAASLVLAIGLAWQFWTSDGASMNFDLGAIAGLSRADELTQLAVIRHNKCVLRCEQHVHQDPNLPSALGELSNGANERLSGSFASIAPDFSGAGYEFESASLCNPTDQDGLSSLHLLYVNYANGAYLSFFAVPHWSGLDLGNGRSPDRNDPFVHSTRDCDSSSLIAWHENEMTYLVCGRFDAEAMSEVVRHLSISGTVEPSVARPTP